MEIFFLAQEIIISEAYEIIFGALLEMISRKGMISASFYWKSFPFVHLWSRAITHDVYLKEMSEKLALYLPCKRNVFVEKNSFLMFTRDRGRSRMMFTWKKRV